MSALDRYIDMMREEEERAFIFLTNPFYNDTDDENTVSFVLQRMELTDFWVYHFMLRSDERFMTKH